MLKSEGEHTAGPIAHYLEQLHQKLSALTSGHPATYIPELAKVDPSLFGISLATVDGALYGAGDVAFPLTIQSVSKPFVYGEALQQHGRAKVLHHVGVEPTGEAFNSIVLDEQHNRPFNPMVNAGAIATAELIRGENQDERIERMLALFSAYAGRPLDMDMDVFQSEKATGHRNRAIAYMMLNSGMIHREPEQLLDLYFRQCSIRVTCSDLAVMAATLANRGVNPLTGIRALDEEYIPDVLTVMNSCGMYNYAGQWSYEIGLPAKSGVSGIVIAVIPGQAGIAVFSPPIDQHGNSVRGVAACLEIASEFGLHVFRHQPSSGTIIRRELRGDVVRSKRMRSTQERHILDEVGTGIVVVEAQGPLFFGSAERLIRRLQELTAGGADVILDLRRIHEIDGAAAHLLSRLVKDTLTRGRRLMFAHLAADGPLAVLHTDLADAGHDLSVLVFDHRDLALEHCENHRLAARAPNEDKTRFSLAGLGIFRGLPAMAIKILEGIARPLIFDKGQVIVREGDEAKLLFVIARGTVAVQLGVGGGRQVRVASIGPGLSFGEMALIDGGHRSADVIAEERVVCYGFSIDHLHEIGRGHPEILTAIYANMMRDFSERLRRSNDEIRALEH